MRGVHDTSKRQASSGGERQHEALGEIHYSSKRQASSRSERTIEPFTIRANVKLARVCERQILQHIFPRIRDLNRFLHASGLRLANPSFQQRSGHDRLAASAEIKVLNNNGQPDIFVPVKPPFGSPEKLPRIYCRCALSPGSPLYFCRQKPKA